MKVRRNDQRDFLFELLTTQRATGASATDLVIRALVVGTAAAGAAEIGRGGERPAAQVIQPGQPTILHRSPRQIVRRSSSAAAGDAQALLPAPASEEKRGPSPRPGQSIRSRQARQPPIALPNALRLPSPVTSSLSNHFLYLFHAR